ncbi:DMT family protein [Limnobacter sp.]
MFLPFSIFFMKEPPRLDYLWSGICLMGAVYFMFRGK